MQQLSALESLALWSTEDDPYQNYKHRSCETVHLATQPAPSLVSACQCCQLGVGAVPYYERAQKGVMSACFA